MGTRVGRRIGAAVAATRALLRGLTARRWSSLALLFTASLTVAAATLGPLYARAAQESVLHDALAALPARDTGLSTSFSADLTSADGRSGPFAHAPAAGVLPVYPTRIGGLQARTRASAPGSSQSAQQTDVVARDGVCGQIVLSRGRCPTGPGEAAVSARTVASPYGYTLGGTVSLPDLPQPSQLGPDGAPLPADPSQLTIVGIYTPVDPLADYWLGHPYFNAALSYQDDKPDIIDAVLVDPSTFPDFGVAPGQVVVDFPLDVDRVHLDDLATLGGRVSQLTQVPAPGGTYRDELPSTLSTVAGTRAQVGIGSLLVSLQLAALALFVLFTVTGDALEARGADVALAKLRGLGAGATLRFLLGESLALLVLAVPVGALLGVLATRVLAATVLAPGVSVRFPAAAALAAVAAFAGASLAAVVAGRRVLTRPVLEQWRGAPRARRHGRYALVAEGVLAAAAVTGSILLATGSSGDIALLAPGLLVLAVALLGIRVLPLLARRGVAASQDSARLGGYLAVRQIARRPAGLRLGALLVVAIGLAVFAVAGESIAVRNRTDRAQTEIGAPRVVGVQFAPQADPVELAHDADPDGRWAMVAARWLPDGGSSVLGSVLGVDPTRLTAAGFPTTDGATLQTLAGAIDVPLPPAVELHADTIGVTVAASALVGTAPYVDVVVTPVQRAPVKVRLGTLTAGTQTYSGSIPCTIGCRLSGFAWERPVSVFDAIGGTVTITSVTTTSGGVVKSVDLHLDDAGGWRARSPDRTDAQTDSRLTVGTEGIADTFTSTGGGSAGIGRVSSPDALPIWAGARSVTTPPPLSSGEAAPMTVLDANGIGYPLTVAGTSTTVPGAGTEGVMGDVSSLRNELPSFTSEATWSVWLGPDAPSDALARLAAAGLDPGGVTLTSARISVLGRQGPALALALLLACAIAAAVLATGATATAIAASGRRRSFEFSALRVLGVRRAALTRATIFEQGALLGTGLVLGVPSGIVAALVAMPVIPQFSDTSPLPLRNVPQPWPILEIAATFLVILLVTAVVAGSLLVRAAVPSRLREASG